MNIPCGQAELPPERDYVTVKDGHLSLHGERQRYWAAIGKLYLSAGVKPGDSETVRKEKVARAHAGTDRLLQRFKDLGFNGFRLWTSLPNTEHYVVGDGSPADSADYFIQKAKENGFRIWAAGMNNAGDLTPEAADLVDDPATVGAWKEAIAKLGPGNTSVRGAIMKFWDPRVEALLIQRMKEVATHTNQHNGLRWADDPVFAVWEISNEEWWMRKMVGGQWQKLPDFFRNELVTKWNDWLRTKYGSDEKLRSAWGELLPGETLREGSILFAPMAGASNSSVSINDSNAQALAAVSALKQTYSREDFSAARGADVLEFLVSLHVGHKQRVAQAVKSWGRSTKLSPLLYDTGIGYEIQSQYLQQQSGAVSHDAYVNGWGPKYVEPDLAKAKTEREKKYEQLAAERISANSGPWVNWLLKPPGITQGVPWLEQNKEEGLPFLTYETQIQQPAKYRADFPLRLAALGAIQDWDFVCWHYFNPGDDVATADRPFDKPLDITTGAHPQGYHYTYDEVQNAMMRAAGLMWRRGSFAPAGKPTKFIYGRKSLYDPASMDYAGSYGETGLDMLQTTYEYGTRIQIDPSREEDEVVGPVVTFADRLTHNPYKPTPEILFDWKKGYLSMDSPSAVAWTGLLANYGDKVEFQNGVILRNVKINNPQGIYEPITEQEKYIAFALHSRDGQPLSKTRSASLSLVSTSFNTGFQLGKEAPEPNKAPVGTQAGGLPVLVARVGATVEARALEGMHYVFRDWEMKEIGAGKIMEGTLTIPADKPVFVVELSR